MSIDMAPRFGFAASDHLLHHDASRDDGQIGRQRALLAESTQHRVIILDQADKDLRAQIVHIVAGDPDTADMSGVADDMDKQTDKTINEILPSPWRTRQALLEKSSINIGQRHR